MQGPVSALLTDSYQLSMMQAYLDHGMRHTAVFELFVRKLPRNRNFLIAAGLEQALEYLESLNFTPEEIQWLAGTGRYRKNLLDYLETFRFTGDVDALSEGTPFFPNEPIFRVIAPLPEAQLVESRIINLLHLETILASKAIRSVLVASGKQLVDFGMRRAHGSEAALLAARASYLAGFSGTSTVQAGMLYGIPVFGTMAHSFIQAHEHENTAFLHFAESQRGPATFLLDTYDTERAAERLGELLPVLQARGIPVQGVRLDSGDLAQHSKSVRAILDRGGHAELKIFVSGGVDERVIQDLLSAGAPIDGFGVGTRLTTSADAPYLDCAYKIQEYDGRALRKKSEGKATWPGRKQVFRKKDPRGMYSGDELRLGHEIAGESTHKSNEREALLHPVMRNGKRLAPPIPIKSLQERTLREVQRLPEPLRRLEPAEMAYPVIVSEQLVELAKRVDLSDWSL